MRRYNEKNWHAIGWLLLLIVAAMFSVSAKAQTPAPTMTFASSVTNAAGSLNTTLTWSSTPAASSCIASGSPAWTGEQGASGTKALPTITLSGTYQLKLDCSWAGDTTATVTWTIPTTNTDGSALTNLAGFQVFRRMNNPDLNGGEMTPVNDPKATTYVFKNLLPGTHYFGVQAVNADGVPSMMSNVANKVISGTTAQSASVTLTVNPKPSPTVVTVK